MSDGTVKRKPGSGKGLKGSVLLLISKLWFVITGYGIYFGLNRILGVEDFGRYGLVVGAVTIVNMCFIKGTLQAVSKFVSEDPSRSAAVRHEALRVQFWLGGGSFIVFFLAAPLIADLLRAPEITSALRFASLIILFYSFYAVFMGVLNGEKQFTRQAFFDISYSTLKLILLLALASLFHLEGAIIGFASAALLVLIGSATAVGFRRPAASFARSRIIRFCLPVMALTLVIHLIMHLDLFMLKRLGEAGKSALLAGWYTADLTVARLPFMLVVSALALVIFPFISEATSRRRREQTALYIRQGMRLTYLVVILGTALIASSPRAALGLIYRPEFAAGAPALAWITGGYLFFSLFMISLIVISGSGKPQHSLLLSLAVAAAQFIFLRLLIPAHGILGAAWASGTAFAIGALLTGIYLRRRLGAYMKFLSFFRITVSGIAVFLISGLVTAQGVLLPVKYAVLVLIYLVILILLREVGRKDWETVLATLPFGSQRG